MISKQEAIRKPTESKLENLDMKTAVSEVEYVEGTGPRNAQEAVHPGPSFIREDENNVCRKLDWNLMPLAFGLCSLSFIDRSNIENTKIAGMKDDIDLSGRRYDWLATAFYGLRVLVGLSVASCHQMSVPS